MGLQVRRRTTRYQSRVRLESTPCLPEEMPWLAVQVSLTEILLWSLSLLLLRQLVFRWLRKPQACSGRLPAAQGSTGR